MLYLNVPLALIECLRMGFGVPIGDWLCDPLREWASDLLSKERLRREGLFSPEPVQRA